MSEKQFLKVEGKLEDEDDWNESVLTKSHSLFFLNVLTQNVSVIASIAWLENVIAAVLAV